MAKHKKSCRHIKANNCVVNTFKIGNILVTKGYNLNTCNAVQKKHGSTCLQCAQVNKGISTKWSINPFTYLSRL